MQTTDTPILAHDSAPRFGRYAWLLACLMLVPQPGRTAEDGEKTWSVSPMLGVFSPRLAGLNKGEFKSPMTGRGTIIFPDSGQSNNFDFTFNNNLPDMRFGAETGLEFGLLLNPRNKLLFGTSVWQSGSTASIQTEMPFQGNITPVGYERSAQLSYFQYYMGWQHTLMSEEKKYSLHARLSMHELFDIDYKENLVFGFQPPDSDTFKRIIVMQSHATGVLMLQLGLGGEYYVRDWISLGGDVGYLLGVQKFRLGNASLSTDITSDDNLNFRTPVQVGLDGKLNYLSQVNSYDDVTYRKLELSFDGWRAMFNVNLYF